MLLDLHVHTTFSSCSELSLETLLRSARTKGLDGVCITDHDTMESAQYVTEGMQPDGLMVIIGMEYATPQGDFLIFGPFQRLRPGLLARELLPIVEGQGGIAIAAHPFRAWRPLDASALNWGAHAIERYNGRNNFEENEQAESLIEEWGLTATGGSDATQPGGTRTCSHSFFRPHRQYP